MDKWSAQKAYLFQFLWPWFGVLPLLGGILQNLNKNVDYAKPKDCTETLLHHFTWYIIFLLHSFCFIFFSDNFDNAPKTVFENIHRTTPLSYWYYILHILFYVFAPGLREVLSNGSSVFVYTPSTNMFLVTFFFAITENNNWKRIFPEYVVFWCSLA